jgi:hypothetical protein
LGGAGNIELLPSFSIYSLLPLLSIHSLFHQPDTD